MEEKMTIDERFKYLRLMKDRYVVADRCTKSRLLDEMVSVTGLERKHLIHRMHQTGPYRHSGLRQRQRTYDAEVEAIVFLIADALGWIGPERLLPVLRPTAEHLARFEECHPSEVVLAKLDSMCLSTLRRMRTRLRPAGAGWPQRRRGRPPEHAIQAQVPIAVIPWQQAEPGHFEADLVHHGPEGGPGHVCTLQCVDVLTGWSECFGLYGHDFEVLWHALQAFRARCPIPVREMHSDNGSEFLNAALQSVFGDLFHGARLTRGRPGCKNDNRFVEQKNSSHVRAYVGDLPLSTRAQAQQLNALYETLWLYSNFFQPVLRQVARTAVLQANGICRIHRRQDEAQTPLQRLLRASPPLSRGRIQELQALYEQTNPRRLKQQIQQQLVDIRQSVLVLCQVS